MNPAPYAADTRAKGWRFELDHERIRQSDTWALARADLRPWLLMLWMVAWEQAPCGSLPADDSLIAARIDMPAHTFAKHRTVLLRGWVKAEDGRLYHPVITERVLEMVEYREKAAGRKAAYRDAHRSPASVPRDSTSGDDTGTGTGTGTGTNKEKGKRPRKARATPLPDDFRISWRVEVWATQKGYSIPDCNLQLEAFVSYAKRKGATYVDWDEALMTAIREDWAKYRTGKPQDIARTTVPSTAKPSTWLAEQEEHRKAVEAERIARKQGQTA